MAAVSIELARALESSGSEEEMNAILAQLEALGKLSYETLEVIAPMMNAVRKGERPISVRTRVKTLMKRWAAEHKKPAAAAAAKPVEETAAETTSPTPPSPAAARRTAVSEGAEWRRAVRSLRGWGELPLARISKDLFSISVPPPQMTRYAHQQNVLTSEMRPIELALGASQSHALIALLVDPDFGLDDLRRVHEAVVAMRALPEDDADVNVMRGAIWSACCLGLANLVSSHQGLLKKNIIALVIGVMQLLRDTDGWQPAPLVERPDAARALETFKSKTYRNEATNKHGHELLLWWKAIYSKIGKHAIIKAWVQEMGREIRVIDKLAAFSRSRRGEQRRDCVLYEVEYVETRCQPRTRDRGTSGFHGEFYEDELEFISEAETSRKKREREDELAACEAPPRTDEDDEAEWDAGQEERTHSALAAAVVVPPLVAAARPPPVRRPPPRTAKKMRPDAAAPAPPPVAPMPAAPAPSPVSPPLPAAGSRSTLASLGETTADVELVLATEVEWRCEDCDERPEPNVPIESLPALPPGATRTFYDRTAVTLRGDTWIFERTGCDSHKGCLMPLLRVIKKELPDDDARYEEWVVAIHDMYVVTTADEETDDDLYIIFAYVHDARRLEIEGIDVGVLKPAFDRDAELVEDSDLAPSDSSVDFIRGAVHVAWRKVDARPDGCFRARDLTDGKVDKSVSTPYVESGRAKKLFL